LKKYIALYENKTSRIQYDGPVPQTPIVTSKATREAHYKPPSPSKNKRLSIVKIFPERSQDHQPSI
jgi:hypothetical protein